MTMTEILENISATAGDFTLSGARTEDETWIKTQKQQQDGVKFLTFLRNYWNQ